MTLDKAATKERLKKHRSWLPLVDIVRGVTVPAVLDVDHQQFAAAQEEIAPTFEKPALPKRIVFENAQFGIAEPEPGYNLDEQKFAEAVKRAAASGRTKLLAPVVMTHSDEPVTGLEDELAKLTDQLKTKITFSVNGQPKQPSPGDIGAWFVPAQLPNIRTMAFSPDKAQGYVQTLAPDVYNAANAAAAAGYALDKKQELTFVLATNQVSVKHTYCTDARGVDQAHMPNFINKVAAVLGDPRGWNIGGAIAFNRVDSNCEFTVWLSAPSQMTSFGGLCDAYYSCRSGRNVVINFDRWQGATDPWNASGGSLEDYRAMVTNHEVGHWLGFGHGNCPGPGQAAPVMQQQSISLQGCTFNPWPTSGELTTLKQNEGVAYLLKRLL